MTKRNLFFIVLVAIAFVIATVIPIGSQNGNGNSDYILTAGRNVNMVPYPKIDPDTEELVLNTGDQYLQRQNEPSIAVSTRNPLHLLAGANDYRTVDIPIVDEELPGEQQLLTASGDAWLGVFRSYDGGQSWKSSLLPGYLQDTSPEGMESPIWGLKAGADPTVRAGTNGMFYYSGLAFDRVERGRSVIFVARFIDNNNDESGDSIQYIDTSIIDEGTSGQFQDKPWIAVDIPRPGYQTATLDVKNSQQPQDPQSQTIPCGNVYMVYSIFLGDMVTGDVHSKIMFAKSTDCGTTWSRPVKLSESQHVNQGTILAVDPNTGTIYIAWRRFTSEGEPDAILFCKSDDYGNKFTKAVEVASILPFDQGTSEFSFRTSSLPSIAVDETGIVYLAWAERYTQDGDARIVISTSYDGKNWSIPTPIENHADRGHQIMPSLTYGAGRLTAVWYDLRYDQAGINPNSVCGVQFDYEGFDEYIVEDCTIRHTMDVRAAQAFPGQSPVFEQSIQVSRYIWALQTDGFGNPILKDGKPQIMQVQFNPPNYPLFKLGTVPFMGDYIDIAPSPMFLPVLNSNGGWRFNADPIDPSNPSEIPVPPIFYAAWTDNRDVRPPADGDWQTYNPPPGYDYCFYDRTGMRNQNVYSSRLSPGLVVGSPGNTKPLNNEFLRAFVVFVKNTTRSVKGYLLTIIDQPPDGYASFFPYDLPIDPQNPPDIVDNLYVYVAPHSSISRPIFVASSDPNASIKIEVKEALFDPDGNHQVIQGGLQSYTIMNPDPTNPDIDIPDIDIEGIVIPDIDISEVHNPDIDIPDIDIIAEANSNIVNPDIDIPDIDIASLINNTIINPDIDAPDIDIQNLVSPDIDAPDIDTFDIVNSAVDNDGVPYVWDNGTVTDVKWTVRNLGNTTSSYNFKSIAPESLPEGIYAQLIIYRIYYTPSANTPDDDGFCDLKKTPHHELLVNIINPKILLPDIDIPDIDIPDIDIPDIDIATFFLAPGDEALVTLRIVDPGYQTISRTLSSGRSFDPEDYGNSVGAAAVSQAPEPDGSYSVSKTPLQILTLFMPDGDVGVEYDTMLKAFGGTGIHTWSLISGNLPPGLSFIPGTGVISGTPLFDNTLDYPQTYSFDVEVADESDPQQIVPAAFSITINAPTIEFTSASSRGSEYPGGTVNLALTLSEEWDAAVKVDYTVSGTATLGQYSDYTIGPNFDANLKKGTVTIPKGELSTNINLNIINDNLYEYDETIVVTLSNPYNAELGANQEHTHLIENDDPMPTIQFSLADSERAEGLSPLSLQLILDAVSGVNASVNYTVDIEKSTATGGVDYNLLGEGTATIIAGGTTTNINIEIIDDNLYELGETIVITLSNAQYAILGANSEYTYTILNDDPMPIIQFELTGSSGLEYVSNVTLQLELSTESGVDATVNYAVDTKNSTAGKDVQDYFLEQGTATITKGNLTTEIELIIIDDFLDELDETVIIELLNPVHSTLEGAVNPSHTYTILDDDVVIEGTVTVGGYPLEGVTITGFPVPPPLPVTDENGRYAAIVPLLWTGTATPEKEGYEFDPPFIEYKNGIVTNISGQDYTVKPKKEEWVERYNNTPVNDMDEATAVTVDSSGNFYVTGYSTGKTTGPDIYTIKYNSSGTALWERRYDGPSHLGDFPTDIVVDIQGNVYVTGFIYRGKVVKHADYCTLKYDSSGNLIWDVKYDSRRNGNDEATAIAVDSAGNVYVTGRSQESLTKEEFKSFDFHTMKYDSSGSMVWEMRYDGPAEGDDEALAIAVDSTGVYVTGFSYEGSGKGNDYYTVEYNINDGTIIWEAKYNGPESGNDEATAIAVDSNGNAYVTGKSEVSGTNFDYATIKYKPDGTPAWSGIGIHNGAVRYDGPGHDFDEAVDIEVDSSGVYVTGKSTGVGTGLDYATIKYGDLGNPLWNSDGDGAIRYNGPSDGEDAATDIEVDSSGVYVTGWSKGTGTDFDYYTAKHRIDNGYVLWFGIYNNTKNSTNGKDKAFAIAVDLNGDVYVTGLSLGTGTANDFATVKYIQEYQ